MFFCCTESWPSPCLTPVGWTGTPPASPTSRPNISALEAEHHYYKKRTRLYDNSAKPFITSSDCPFKKKISLCTISVQPKGFKSFKCTDTFKFLVSESTKHFRTFTAKQRRSVLLNNWSRFWVKRYQAIKKNNWNGVFQVSRSHEIPNQSENMLLTNFKRDVSSDRSHRSCSRFERQQTKLQKCFVD